MDYAGEGILRDSSPSCGWRDQSFWSFAYSQWSGLAGSGVIGPSCLYKSFSVKKDYSPFLSSTPTEQSLHCGCAASNSKDKNQIV